MDVSMYHYDAVDSTNTQCRRLAAEGVVNAVVTADCQTGTVDGLAVYRAFLSQAAL